MNKACRQLFIAHCCHLRPAVSNTPFGLNRIGIRHGVGELGAQATHMHVHGARVDMFLGAPHMPQQCFARPDLSGMGDQHRQQIELARPELEPLPMKCRRTAWNIQLHRGGLLDAAQLRA